MKKAWITGLIIRLNGSVVWSDTLNIMVVGLFSGQAVLIFNKQQHLLKVGKTTPEGVTLISATSQKSSP
jgi:aspartyl protease family protein